MNLLSFVRNRPRAFNALHRLGLIGAFSQTSQTELSCLAKYANQKKAAVEIGTFMGVAAAIIARAIASGGKLYCVDPYDGGEALSQIAVRHIKRSGIESKIQLVRAFSQDALPHLPEQVDFMFIDGDHSYQGLSRDWQIVLRRLQPGGIACFHDTSMLPSDLGQYCGAAEFFDQHIRNAPGFTNVETVETLNVMRRDS